MSGSQAAIEVLRFADGKFIGSQVFTSKTVSIGRKKGSMVRLDDPSISTNHAVLHFTGRSCLIEDCGSRNGIFLDGKRVDSRLIEPTDELVLGKFTLRFVIHFAEDDLARGEGPAPTGEFQTVASVATGEFQTPPPKTEPTLTAFPELENVAKEVGRSPFRTDSFSSDPFRSDSFSSDPFRSDSFSSDPFRSDSFGSDRFSGDTGAGTVPGGPSARVPPSRSETDELLMPEAVDLADGTLSGEVRAAQEIVQGIAVQRIDLFDRKPDRPRDRQFPEGAGSSKPPAAMPKGSTPPPVMPKGSTPPPVMPKGSTPPPVMPFLDRESDGPTGSVALSVDTSEVDLSAVDISELAYESEGQDSDEDDEPFDPPFDYLEALRGQSERDPHTPKDLIVEIITYDGDFVSDIRHLAVGDCIGLQGASRFCHYQTPGQAILQVGALPTALYRDGATLDATDLRTRPHGTIELVPTVGATCEVGLGQRVHVHFVQRADGVAREPVRIAPKPHDVIATALSGAMHFLVFLLLATNLSRDADAMDQNEARFAKVALKDLELEPPPEKAPAPAPAPEPSPPQKTAPAAPKPTKTASVPRPRPKGIPTRAPEPSRAPGPVAPAKPSASASKLLSALGGSMPSSNAAQSATAVATTNLDAVGPSRSGGGYKASGVIGKVPSGQLQLAGGGSGSGRVNTKSGAEITGGGKVGKVSGVGGGQVRGIVTRAPAREVQVQGELDRSEIQKVVNAHLREVQACYERKLLKDPSLQGKIAFEWTVQPSGSVGVVRIKFSSIRNTEVASCIQSSIQGWRFPQPKGGAVTVIYPFVFGTVGAGL